MTKKENEYFKNTLDLSNESNNDFILNIRDLFTKEIEHYVLCKKVLILLQKKLVN